MARRDCAAKPGSLMDGSLSRQIRGGRRLPQWSVHAIAGETDFHSAMELARVEHGAERLKSCYRGGG